MGQETSKKSWDEFKSSESHAKLIRTVIETLEISKYPLTGREICMNSGIEGLWKRLSEMRKMGIVVEKGKRRCSVTGKTALIWGLNI
jgi:hypothetical protein